LGVRAANHGPVLDSLAELDAVDRVSTPNGDMWYRYNHDSYGESQADGTGWPAGHGSRTGRLWPLLSGERGEYELAAGRPATSHLQTMANAGNDGYLIPEQVWDRASRFGFAFGEATGSAAPLNWAAAQYVRLALSIDAGRPVETPSIVTARYAGQ
jgi:glucoamylase